MTITFLNHWNSGLYLRDMTQMISAFEKLHPGVKVVNVDVPGGSGYTKYLTAAAAGAPYDVYDMEQGYFASLVSRGALAPVDLSVFGVKSQASLESLFLPTAVAGYVWNGRLYALPYEFSDYVAWYNTALFKKAHLPLPRTWAQVAADGKKLLVVTKGKVTGEELQLPLNCPACQALVLNALAAEAGQPLFNAQGTVSYVDGPAAVKALTMLQQLAYVYKATVPSATPTAPGNALTLFEAGTDGMTIDAGSWLAGVLASASPAVAKTAVAAPYPTFPGRPTAAPAYGYGLVVSAASKHQKVAWEFVRFLEQPNNLLTIFKLGEFSGLKSLDATSVAKHTPFWESVYVPTLTLGVYLPSLIHGTQIDGILASGMDRILLDHAPVAATLKQINAEIVPLLNH